jgi:DNA invertase Pin-like site-specific DNA recombinase
MMTAGSPARRWTGLLCSSRSPTSRRGGDTIAVYKVDRLTRHSTDFAKIVEILDTRGASFLSVTQQLNIQGRRHRLLIRAIAYDLQERARGSSKLALRRR